MSSSIYLAAMKSNPQTGEAVVACLYKVCHQSFIHPVHRNLA